MSVVWYEDYLYFSVVLNLYLRRKYKVHACVVKQKANTYICEQLSKYT